MPLELSAAFAQSFGPQGGFGGDGPNGLGGAGGGPGQNGQPGTGQGAGTGGAAGSNATVGATGTNGGGKGGFGAGGDGGGGGPSITGTGTTPTLNNSAGTTLTGSAGEGNGANSGSGAGGYGVVVTTGGGSNAGTINGGAGGTNGGAFGNVGGGSGNGGEGGGALFLGTDIVFNNLGGTISGTASNGFQVTSGGGTTPQNGGAGGRGGAGVEFAGSNSTFNVMGGRIAGASGGGAGSGGDNANQGGIAGAGGAGGAGGVGVAFDQSNGVLNNAAGIIVGGVGNGGGQGGQNISAAGGFGGLGGVGGAGGSGVAFQGSDNAFTNSGTITGGNGGGGGQGREGSSGNFFLGVFVGTGGNGGTGGSGGNGVSFVGSGNTLTNSGTISGGNGGAAGGAGGIGIVGSNLIIANTGTINGGFTNTSTAPNPPLVIIPGPPFQVIFGGEPFTAGAQAYAVQFTRGQNFVGGGGTINGGVYVAGGSFQPALPGSVVGTPLTVNGPIAFAPGTFYNVRITPTQNDSAIATGTATLTGAAVNVLAGNGTYQTGRRTILTANSGLGGTTFSGVSTNLAFLTPTLSYDQNNVYLNVTGNGANGSIDYRTAARTQNQRAVAGGLTNAGLSQPGGNGGRVLGALNQLTAPQAQAAFDSLSGEGITAAQNVANRSAQLFTSSIFDQTTFYGSGSAANSITLTEPIRELADLPARAAPPIFVQPNRTWRAWATGYGGVDNIHGNGVIGSAYQQNTIYGGTLGVDYQLTPNYLVGVALGGSNGDFRVAGRATSGSSTGGHIAIYDLATFGAFYGASSSSFSYFGNRTNRFVSGFGGLGGETERGNFNSNELRTRLEFGRHFAGYGGVLTPFVAMELAQLRSNGFTENAIQGAGLFRLNVSGQSQASAPAFVGLRLQRVTSIGNGITLSPTLQVAYVHEFAPYRSQIGTLADLPGSTFLIDGARPARNAAQVKAGAEMAIGQRSVIFANFDGELSGVNQLYAGKGGFRYAW